MKNNYPEYDFIERKVCPTCYTIKPRHNNDGHHPISQVTEGSNMIEKSYWTILNQHDNDRRIKGKNVCYTFEMKEQREFYRYLHIRQTGTDSGLKYGKLLKCNK